jgi:asparagine synthase (glutamine-hydrolysing)
MAAVKTKGAGVVVCGIAGAIDKDARRAAARVTAMNDAQEHRGPDHKVVSTVGIFTIGNTRLAIQDPGPAANQPFVSADGRYHCVFNGEVYNHRQLAERYSLPVRTACDGEVIPALWAKLGIQSLSELRGMFAIAIVDSLEGRLYLARDAFGIKPLYWRFLPDTSIIFASEVRPLVRMGAGLRIDSAAIARYLHLGAMASDQAPFLEVTAMPPNSVATFDGGSLAGVRPILAEGPLGSAQSHASLENALFDSVDLHLAADVPTALLLSGGVDSATIAAVGRRIGRDLNCLTISTPGAADESAEAAVTASHYGHRFQRVKAALQVTDVENFFRSMQRPSIDGLNTYLISKAVHEAGFKVALSGLGGDEVVGGYTHFRLLRHLRALRIARTIPRQLTAAAAKALTNNSISSEAKMMSLLSRHGPEDGRQLSLLQREVLARSLVAELTGSSMPPEMEPPARRQSFPERFSAMVAAEVEIYLQAMLLSDSDSFSMASSVELRVPFVDCSVFRASLALAENTRKRPGKEAIGLAFDDPYLMNLAARPKRGFSIPMREWMSESLAPVLDAANAPDAAVWSVLDRRVAERVGLVPLKARDRWAEPWAIAALNAWLETVSQVSAAARMKVES